MSCQNFWLLNLKITLDILYDSMLNSAMYIFNLLLLLLLFTPQGKQHAKGNSEVSSQTQPETLQRGVSHNSQVSELGCVLCLAELNIFHKAK